jgi:predicted phosphoadenosine phosphosulfate sulfurtransferase
MNNRSFLQKAGERFKLKDDKSAKLALTLLDTVVRGHYADKLESIVEWYNQKGFITKPQREFINQIKKVYVDHEFEAELTNRLKDAYDYGSIPPTAENFVIGALTFFEQNNYYTEDQKERAIQLIQEIAIEEDICN